MINTPRVNTRQIKPKSPQIRPTQIGLVPSVGFISEYNKNIHRQEYQALMKDRNTVHSLFDIFLNRGARAKLEEGSWYEGSNGLVRAVAGTFHAYIDLMKRGWDFSDPVSALMQNLRTFGDTMDMFSTLTVKPFLYMYDQVDDTGWFDAVADLTGLSGKGRNNYWAGDFNKSVEWMPENWGTNILLEVAADPSIWFTLGLSLKAKLGKEGSKNAARVLVAHSLDDAAIAMGKGTSKSVVMNAVVPATMSKKGAKQSARTIVNINNAARMKNKKEFIKQVVQGQINGTYNTALKMNDILELYAKATSEITTSVMYNFAVGVLKYERGLRRSVLLPSPVGMSYRGMRTAAGFFKRSVKQVNKIIETNLSNIGPLNKVDFEKLTQEEVNELVSLAQEALKKASKAKDVEGFDKALANLNEAKLLQSGKVRQLQRQTDVALIKGYEKEIVIGKKDIKTVKDNLKQIKDKNSEAYKLEEARLYDLENKQVVVEEQLKRLKTDLKRTDELYKNLNKLQQYQQTPDIYGPSKKNITTLKEYNKVLENIEKQTEEIDSLTKQISSLKKTATKRIATTKVKDAAKEIERLTKERNKVYRLRTQARNSIQVYGAMFDIMEYATYNNSRANLVTGLLNSQYKDIRSSFLKMFKEHLIESYNKVEEANKSVEKYINNFKHGMQTLGPNHMPSDTLDPNKITGLVIKEYDTNVNLIRFWDSIASEEGIHQTYMTDVINDYQRFLNGELLYKYDKTSKTFAFELAQPKGSKETIKNLLIEELINEISVLNLGRPGQKTTRVPFINRLTKQNKQIARLYKTIKTQVDFLQSDRLAPSSIQRRANALDSFYRDLEQIFMTNNPKEINSLLVKFKQDIVKFKNAASKYKTIEEINTNLLSEGSEYEMLSPLLLGKYYNKGGDAARRISEFISDNGKMKQVDVPTLEKYIDLMIAGVDINHRHPLMKAVVAIDTMMDLYTNSKLVVVKNNGVIAASPNLLKVGDKETIDLTVNTVRNLQKLKDVINSLGEVQYRYRRDARGTYNFVEEVNKIIQSKQVGVLDERLADNFLAQHMIAINQLHVYEKAPHMILNGGVLDIENMRSNLINYIVELSKGKDLNLTIDQIKQFSDTELTSFYLNVLYEYKENVHLLFDQYVEGVDSYTVIFNRLKELEVQWAGDAKYKTNKEYIELSEKLVRKLEETKDFGLSSAQLKEKQKILDTIKYDLKMGNSITRPINLLQAIIYRQEYYPVFSYIQSISNANYIFGNELLNNLNDLQTMVKLLSQVKTDLKTGAFISVPDEITKYVQDIHGSLDRYTLEEIVDMYNKDVFKNIIKEVKAIESKLVIDQSYQSASATAKASKNNFYEFINEDSLLFGREVEKKVLKEMGQEQVIIRNIKGGKYEGNIDVNNAKFAHIDIETTGLDYTSEEVFNVGITITLPDGTVEHYNYYLNTSKPLSNHISNLTGHSNEFYQEMIAKQQGQGIYSNDDVKRLITDLLDDNTILVAHNADFELSYLSQYIDMNTVNSNVPVLDSLVFTNMYAYKAKELLEQNIETITGKTDRLTKRLLSTKAKITELKKSNGVLNETKKLNKRVSDIQNQIKQNEKLIQESQSKLNILESIDNNKQETLVKALLSDARVDIVRENLAMKYPELAHMPHQGLYDSAMLAEIMNSLVDLSPDPNVNTFGKLMKNTFNIQYIKDFNTTMDVTYNASEIKNINNIINSINLRLVNILEIKEDLGGLNALNIEDLRVDQLTSTVMRNLDELNQLLAKGNYKNLEETRALYRLIIDTEDYLEEAINMIQKETTGSIRFVSNVSENYKDNIDVFKQTLDEVLGIKQDLIEKRDLMIKVNEAMYGDTYAKIQRSKLYRSFEILAEHKNNDQLRTTFNILKGRADLVTGNHKDYAEAFHISLKNVLKQSNIDVPDNASYADVVDIYRKNMPYDDYIRYWDLIDDIDEYSDFMHRIYTDLNNRIKILNKQGKTQEVEMLRIGAARVNELLDKLEDRYFKLIRNAKTDNKILTEDDYINVLTEALGDRNISPLLKNEVFRNETGRRFLGEYTGMNTVNQIDKFVRKRIKKYMQHPEGNFRLFINIDTATSHDLYYHFKNTLLDSVYEAYPTIYQNMGASTVATIQGPFKDMDILVRGGLGNLRNTLKNIKVENDIAPRYNMGYINKTIERLKRQGNWEYDNFLSTGELVERNESMIFKMTDFDLAKTQLKRKYAYLLEDITELPVGLRSYVDSNSDSYLKRLLDNYIRVLTGQEGADSSIFANYTRNNRRLTIERAHRVEAMDSLMARAENNETIQMYRNALRSIEEWALGLSRNPDAAGSYFKRLPNGDVDPAAVNEFMQRIKASTFEYLEDISPANLKEAITDLYEQGFSKRDLFMSKRFAVEEMSYVSRMTHDLYKQISDVFGEGPEADEAMFNFLKNSDEGYSFAVYEFNNAYDKGVTISRVRVNSVQELAQLRNQLSNTDFNQARSIIGIVDDASFSALKGQLNQAFRYKSGTIPDLLRKFYLMPLKSSMLLNPSFLINNFFEGVSKNLIEQEGGIIGTVSLMGDFANAVKFNKIYSETVMEAFKDLPVGVIKSKDFQNNWVDYYRRHLTNVGKMTPKMERNLTIAEDLMPFYNNQATGMFTDIINALDKEIIGKAKGDGSFDKAIKKIFFGSKLSPFHWNLKANSKLELYSRLTMYINATRNGLNESTALRKVIKSFFDYSNKGKAEVMAETAIPFVSFFIRNTMWALEVLHEKPHVLQLYSKLITRSYGQQTITENDYAAYLASRGRFPVGNYAIDVGIGIADAMNISAAREGTYIPFSEQTIRKTNPMIRGLVEPSDRTPVERLQRMPLISTGVQLTGAYREITAGGSGDTDLSKVIPGVNPYNNANRVYRNTRYRNSQFRENYKSYRWNLIPNTKRAVRWRMTNLDRYKGIRY